MSPKRKIAIMSLYAIGYLLIATLGMYASLFVFDLSDERALLLSLTHAGVVTIAFYFLGLYIADRQHRHLEAALCLNMISLPLVSVALFHIFATHICNSAWNAEYNGAVMTIGLSCAFIVAILGSRIHEVKYPETK
ncbi:hypothetical protein CZP2022_22 [Vibrio phage C-ZP2022]|nr:hypothetical protein CZP2022_22 [Vibrio phage C-ZP2022]